MIDSFSSGDCCFFSAQMHCESDLARKRPEMVPALSARHLLSSSDSSRGFLGLLQSPDKDFIRGFKECSARSSSPSVPPTPAAFRVSETFWRLPSEIACQRRRDGAAARTRTTGPVGTRSCKGQGDAKCRGKTLFQHSHSDKPRKTLFRNLGFYGP